MKTASAKPFVCSVAKTPPLRRGLLSTIGGSMLDKISDVTAAARGLSSNPKDQMFVVTFNERVLAGPPGAKAFTGLQYRALFQRRLGRWTV